MSSIILCELVCKMTKFKVTLEVVVRADDEEEAKQKGKELIKKIIEGKIDKERKEKASYEESIDFVDISYF